MCCLASFVRPEHVRIKPENDISWSPETKTPTHLVDSGMEMFRQRQVKNNNALFGNSFIIRETTSFQMMKKGHDIFPHFYYVLSRDALLPTCYQASQQDN